MEIMTLTIDLNPELAAQLEAEAAKSGIDANTFVVRALEAQLRPEKRSRPPSHLPAEETALLQKINQGLPEEIWQEYHDLITKRRNETLTQEEHARLMVLSNSIEETHVQRMVSVAELARMRQVPLKTLMDQLGIKPRKV
jgi:hypothetical protein